MIDLIGDIHGHADKLEELLLKLGYAKNNSAYSHPVRKVLFVGDYIDRGPKIRETLEIVKAMVNSENAIALMGEGKHGTSGSCNSTNNASRSGCSPGAAMDGEYASSHCTGGNRSLQASR